MKRKFFSILLSLAMMVTMMPAMTMTASAIPSTDWDSLKSAVERASEGDPALFEVTDNLSTNVRTIKLLQDITAISGESQMTVEATGNGIVLDLNGHTLNINARNADTRRAFRVEGKLTIKDSSDINHNGTGTGKIIKGLQTTAGGAISVRSGGELIVESGAICDNKTADIQTSSPGGGAIYCEGKLTISGGAIYHNMACWGGAIGLKKGADFLMTGGRIYENEALVMNGAAINMYVRGDGTITSTIIGGEIYGNISNRSTAGASNDATVGVVSAGNAVWVEGTLYLGGNAKIYGNKQGDYAGSWSNLTNNANLAIVSSGDSGKRGVIKVSDNYPLTSGANIWLSQTSEHVRLVPFVLGSELTNYDITTANGFTANNCKYIHVDGLNNTTGYDVCKTGNAFFTKEKVNPTPDPEPSWVDVETEDEIVTDMTEETKVVVSKSTAYKSGKIKVVFNAITLADGTKVTKYQVRRATNKKFTKKRKTYNASCKATSNTVSFTNAKGLKKGTKYYYKVRGKVKLSDGSWAYTKWSKVQCIKCKKTR